MTTLSPEEKERFLAALGRPEESRTIDFSDEPRYTGESSNDTAARDAIELSKESREVIIPEVSVEDTASGKPAWGAPLRAIQLPKGVPAEEFRSCLAAAYYSYMETGRYDNEELVARTGLTGAQVARCAATPEFKRALAIRGVDAQASGLTAEQDHAILVLTTPDGKSLTQKLKQLRVSHAKYQAWMKNKAFKAAMDSVTNGMLHENSQSLVMLEALSQTGDLKAIQYKHLLNGTFNPNRQDMVDMQALITNVFTVIARHVKDPEQLKNIAGELQALGSERKVIEG